MSYVGRVQDEEKWLEIAIHDSKSSNLTLIVDKKNKIIFDNQIYNNRVSLLTGGGSCHGPFLSSFVGPGLLTAAIVGSACESPPSGGILSAIRFLAKHNKNSGVLVFVMNYLSDIRNFGLAVEEAKSQNIDVEMVVINEDSFQPTRRDTFDSGQTGMCGICFIFKDTNIRRSEVVAAPAVLQNVSRSYYDFNDEEIIGNMAEEGEKLSTILEQSYIINKSTCTIGAVHGRSLSGIGPLFRMNVNYVDVRVKIRSANELIDTMTSKIIAFLDLSRGDEICVAIHKFGLISHLQLGATCTEIYNFLTDRDITTCRMYHGSLDFSVESTGFEISILNITRHPTWLQHLDARTDVLIWPDPCVSIPMKSGRDSHEIEGDCPQRMGRRGGPIQNLSALDTGQPSNESGKRKKLEK